MAVAYLNEGATSFASANWSDSTGFADDATLVINRNGGRITGASLDQSGLTTGIEYLDIRSGVGQIGGSGESLVVDADSSSDAFVRVNSPWVVWLNAGGGSGVVNNAHVGNGGTLHLTGGSFGVVTVAGGTLNAQASAVVSASLYQTGGSSTVDYNATALPLVEVTAGVLTLRRPATSVRVSGTATLELDLQAGAVTNLYVEGGARVRYKRGAVTNAYVNGGHLDFSRVERDDGFGGTTLRMIGEVVQGREYVDLSGQVGIGAYLPSISGSASVPGFGR